MHSRVTSPHISSSLWSPCQSNNNLPMQRDTLVVKVRYAITLSCASPFLFFFISSLSSKENLSENLYSQSSHLPPFNYFLAAKWPCDEVSAIHCPAENKMQCDLLVEALARGHHHTEEKRMSLLKRGICVTVYLISNSTEALIKIQIKKITLGPSGGDARL